MKIKSISPEEWLYEGRFKIYKICDWRYNVLNENNVLVASGESIQIAIKNLEKKINDSEFKRQVKVANWI